MCHDLLKMIVSSLLDSIVSDKKWAILRFLLPIPPWAEENEEKMAIKGQFDSAHIMSSMLKQDVLGRARSAGHQIKVY